MPRLLPYLRIAVVSCLVGSPFAVGWLGTRHERSPAQTAANSSAGAPLPTATELERVAAAVAPIVDQAGYEFQSRVMMATPKGILIIEEDEEERLEVGTAVDRVGRETQSLMMMVTPRIIYGESDEEERLGIAVP